MNDFGLRPDVALVIVNELTPQIPEAVIDPTPVNVGDPVTLTGYGCENGVGQPTTPPRFKVGDTSAVNPLNLSDASSIPGGYVTTYGPGIDPAHPACARVIPVDRCFAPGPIASSASTLWCLSVDRRERPTATGTHASIGSRATTSGPGRTT